MIPPTLNRVAFRPKISDNFLEALGPVPARTQAEDDFAHAPVMFLKSPPRRRALADIREGETMTLAVPRSNWQLQENSYGDAYHEKRFKLTRIYEFADPRATTTVCTLQIACAGISISLAGHVHAYVDFNLRPHRYLGLGQLPPQDDGMITAPFSVSLITEGAGTKILHYCKVAFGAKCFGSLTTTSQNCCH